MVEFINLNKILKKHAWVLFKKGISIITPTEKNPQNLKITPPKTRNDFKLPVFSDSRRHDWSVKKVSLNFKFIY